MHNCKVYDWRSFAADELGNRSCPRAESVSFTSSGGAPLKMEARGHKVYGYNDGHSRPGTCARSRYESNELHLKPNIDNDIVPYNSATQQIANGGKFLMTTTVSPYLKFAQA